MKKILMAVGGMFLSFCSSAQKISSETSKSELQYNTYCNGRFQYCIDYPEFLTPKPESTNGDGRIFVNKENIKILTVFGSLNQNAEGDPISVEQKCNNEIKGLIAAKYQIAYKKIAKRFYVLSGTKNEMIFYHKTIIKGDAFCSAFLEYDKIGKETYDSVSIRIFSSFK